MNDQELTTAVRQSVAGARMSVPEEQISSRSRAIRAGRRRRVTAGVTAAVSAGAAAIAAAVFLPGSAAPTAQHAQDTAYVISHVTQALDAVPADTIFFLQATIGPHSVVADTWARGGQMRIERMTPSGQLASESGYAGTSTTVTTVLVNYQDRTWSRSARVLDPQAAAANARAAVSSACDSPDGFAIPANASKMAASLRAWVACGRLKADGTASVDGVTAIKLTTLMNGVTYTWYVSPATYLPTRMTTTRPGVLLARDDFQWLSPTKANLAQLNLPAAPQGFTQVSMPTP
jgi:hypothetical protein